MKSIKPLLGTFTILLSVAFLALGCGKPKMDDAGRAYIAEINSRLDELTKQIKQDSYDIPIAQAAGDVDAANPTGYRAEFFSRRIEAAQKEQQDLRLKKLEFLSRYQQ
jgi:hypothetical protein